MSDTPLIRFGETEDQPTPNITCGYVGVSVRAFVFV